MLAKREVKPMANTELRPRSPPKEMQKEHMDGPGKGVVQNLHNQQVFSLQKSPDFAPMGAISIMEITVLRGILAAGRAMPRGRRDEPGRCQGESTGIRLLLSSAPSRKPPFTRGPDPAQRSPGCKTHVGIW